MNCVAHREIAAGLPVLLEKVQWAVHIHELGRIQNGKLVDSFAMRPSDRLSLCAYLKERIHGSNPLSTPCCAVAETMLTRARAHKHAHRKSKQVIKIDIGTERQSRRAENL